MNQSKEQTTPKHKLDTPDFLAFSDSQQPDFCPANSSSPQKHWQQSPRNNYSNNKNSRQFSGRNNSYSSPEKPYSKSFSGPFENLQNKRFNSSNHSFNSSFNNTRSSFNSSFENSRSKNNRSFNSAKYRTDDKGNIANYLHPSFMEDPWAKLERNLIQQEDCGIEPDILNDLSSSSGTEALES